MPQTRSQYKAEMEAKLRAEMEAKLQVEMGAKMQQSRSTPLKDATQFMTGMPPHMFTPHGYTIGESSSQQVQPQTFLETFEEQSQEDLSEFQDTHVWDQVERLVLSKPNHYFLQLARMGAKLPRDFDISAIREHNPNTPFVVAKGPSTIVTQSPIISQALSSTTSLSLPIVTSFDPPRLEYTLEPLITPTNVLPLFSQNLNIPPFHVPQHTPPTMTVSMPQVTQAVHVAQAQTPQTSQAIPISHHVQASQTIPTTPIVQASQPSQLAISHVNTTSHIPTANTLSTISTNPSITPYNPNVSLIDMNDPPIVSQANPSTTVTYVEQLASIPSYFSNPSQTINPSYATQGLPIVTQHMTHINPHVVQNTNPSIHPSFVATNPSITYHVTNPTPTSQPLTSVNPSSTYHVMPNLGAHSSQYTQPLLVS